LNWSIPKWSSYVWLSTNGKGAWQLCFSNL